jgi:hypothetical protein
MASKDTEVDTALLEEELVELQISLFLQNFFARPRSRGIHCLSPRQMENIRVRLDAKSHGRPHLHLDYGRQHRTATYAIDTGERLAGELDSRYDGRVANWIEDCRTLLLRAWNQLQDGQSVDGLVWELRGAN